VTYTYDLNDGFGVQEFIETITIDTKLDIRSETAFLDDAVDIKVIGSSANNVSTRYDVSSDTFTISMDVLGLAFSTGIFDTLQSLGVVRVNFGGSDILVTPQNIFLFIEALEEAFNAYNGDDFIITLSFTADIHQDGQQPFNANFIANFQMTEDVYQLFA
jgi:hypothetical protein